MARAIRCHRGANWKGLVRFPVYVALRVLSAIVMLFGSSLLAALALLQLMDRQTSITAAPILGAVITIVLLLGSNSSFAKGLAVSTLTSPMYRVPITYSFDANYLTMRTETAEWTIKWEAIESVRVDHKVFTANTKFHACVMPMSIVPEDERASFVARVKEWSKQT